MGGADGGALVVRSMVRDMVPVGIMGVIPAASDPRAHRAASPARAAQKAGSDAPANPRVHREVPASRNVVTDAVSNVAGARGAAPMPTVAVGAGGAPKRSAERSGPTEESARSLWAHRPVEHSQRQADPAALHDHWIVISLGFFCSAFGMCTLSTPSLLSQWMASALMLSGSEKARVKLP